jgi:hypothetical protein
MTRAVNVAALVAHHFCSVMSHQKSPFAKRSKQGIQTR